MAVKKFAGVFFPPAVHNVLSDAQLNPRMRLRPVVRYTDRWGGTVNQPSAALNPRWRHNLGDHVLRRGESAIQRVGKDDWKNGGQTITGI